MQYYIHFIMLKHSFKEIYMQLAKYQWTTKGKSHVNLLNFLHSPSTVWNSTMSVRIHSGTWIYIHIQYARTLLQLKVSKTIFTICGIWIIAAFAMQSIQGLHPPAGTHNHKREMKSWGLRGYWTYSSYCWAAHMTSHNYYHYQLI